MSFVIENIQTALNCGVTWKWFQEKLHAANLVCDIYHWKLPKTCYRIVCFFSSPEKVFGLSVGKDDSEVISIFMQTRGQLAMSGVIFAYHKWEVLLEPCQVNIPP